MTALNQTEIKVRLHDDTKSWHVVTFVILNLAT